VDDGKAKKYEKADDYKDAGGRATHGAVAEFTSSQSIASNFIINAASAA